MRLRRMAGACALASAMASPLAAQQDYNFDVLYFGGGVTSLAAGSDNPEGATLSAGDSFFWSIAAQEDAYWNVFEGGSFFPFMAFATDPSGQRTGDYTLELFRNGSRVFALSETSVQEYFHIGTNEVTLGTGLQFDRMALSYFLVEAIADDPPVAFGGPQSMNGEPIESVLSGTLPIFGAPELNRFSPGIEYVTTVSVPEPGAVLLLGAGLLAAAAMSRRRGQRVV